MKRRSHIQQFVLGIALMLCATETAMAGGPPSEPTEGYLINEDVNIVTGLYIREYSLAENGIVDYKTARQIIFSEYNEYWNTVVKTKEFPLFYWHDATHDGEFVMYVDRQVEGCTCDIVPYHVYDTNMPAMAY